MLQCLTLEEEGVCLGEPADPFYLSEWESCIIAIAVNREGSQLDVT